MGLLLLLKIISQYDLHIFVEPLRLEVCAVKTSSDLIPFYREGFPFHFIVYFMMHYDIFTILSKKKKSNLFVLL